MGDPKGFLTVKRRDSGYRPVEERVNDYREVEIQLPDDERRLQASRCMDCGVPFCHWGCPVENIMPEWQNLLYRGDWKGAYLTLQETNNFPEFTGRVCPAPCEASCVLALNDDAVTIRQNELAVIERAFELGYVVPRPPKTRSGKRVAVVGSGPAGLASADLLNRAGHTVTVYEAEDSVGGYLRYGIPDFKLAKRIIDRRVDILIAEGLLVRTGVEVGKDLSIAKLREENDAVLIAIGARKTRDLPAEGRDLRGIHYAMEYLKQQNRIVRGDVISDDELIAALGKSVLVIGGGDTGSDCVGSANRQGAKKVLQVEILPEPPRERTDDDPWPLWPRLLKTSSSHEEGCERMWNIMTKKFIGQNGVVKRVEAVRVRWEKNESGRHVMTEVPGSALEIEADLVLIAMGFEHVIHEGLVSKLGPLLDDRGNIKVDEYYMTSVKGVFAAGDSRRGASLVVWAIHEGRMAAAGIMSYLRSR